jgi:hypothetical protein
VDKFQPGDLVVLKENYPNRGTQPFFIKGAYIIVSVYKSGRDVTKIRVDRRIYSGEFEPDVIEEQALRSIWRLRTRNET